MSSLMCVSKYSTTNVPSYSKLRENEVTVTTCSDCIPSRRFQMRGFVLVRKMHNRHVKYTVVSTTYTESR